MSLSFIKNLPVKCGLGEGAVWSIAEQAFFWIDITEPNLYKYSPESDELITYDVPSNPVNVMLTEKTGTLIVTLFDGLYLFDTNTNKWSLWQDVEANKANRLNDGTVDANGNILIGSVTLSPDSEGNDVEMGFDGTLFHLKGTEKSSVKLTDIGIFNLASFSPDNTTFYYADSLKSEIYSCKYNADTTELSQPELFAKLDSKYGDPDGGTVDSQGNVYSARWDGNGIVKLSTTGEMIDFIEVGTPFVTNVCFGGKDLKTVLVTTAGLGSKEEKAGSIQLFQSDVAGIAANIAKL